MDDTLHCPTCGAPLRIKNRFVKAVTCEFCQNVSLYDGVRLDPTGRTASLARLLSPLYLDATGRLGSKTFRTLGRLVYEYDGGTWQEWFLALDGGARAWLQEDEGRFTYLQKVSAEGVPPSSDIQPGDEIQLGDRRVTISEVNDATIVSAEGQLGHQILPGETIRYADGTSGEDEVSIEYGEREVEVFVGRPVPREALAIDPDPFS
ncbi:MAG: DUF4178 domain-containing protein [Bacteroidota bacterium]